MALDLTLLPFYGADAKENDQIYRSQAKRGTCSFYAYASAYIVHKGQRHGCAHGGHPQADDGGRDQGIAPPSPQGRDSRPVPGLGSRVLQRRRDPLFAGGADAVPDAGGGPRPQAGPPAGPQRLAGLQGDEAERLVRVHPERSSEAHGDGADLRQVPEPARRRGKKGREPWIYAYWGIGPKRFDWVKDTYRSRFGVETSYRQMNQCRIRTTTPRFAVRFLYVAIGFLMRNLWVWLHYAVLSSPHRGCRRYNLDRLTLRTMLLWLQEVAFSMYELVKIALCERSVPERLTC